MFRAGVAETDTMPEPFIVLAEAATAACADETFRGLSDLLPRPLSWAVAAPDVLLR